MMWKAYVGVGVKKTTKWTLAKHMISRYVRIPIHITLIYKVIHTQTLVQFMIDNWALKLYFFPSYINPTHILNFMKWITMLHMKKMFLPFSPIFFFHNFAFFYHKITWFYLPQRKCFFFDFLISFYNQRKLVPRWILFITKS